MPYIAWYLLKLSISLGVVYLFYILVLRRLTFYNWNRWYLLGYSLMAFFIPFINISPVLQKGEWDKNLVLQFIPAFGTGHQANFSNQGLAWWSYLLAGAAIGIILMTVRFLIRFISYRRIRKSAQLVVDIGVKVYHVEKSIIPFSFGNAIFINPQLHAEEDLKQIIHHEFIHVKQKHTIDILCGELLCMLNWYNPFAWMIKKAMRQNLEFIADHQVLENGIDKKNYQYLLLKVTGAAHYSITQQFNFSSLKKRIIMMNRSRSAKIQLTRFLFMLPMLTILLLAFRTNVIDHKSGAWIKATKLQLALQEIKQLKIDTVPAKNKNEVWGTDFLKKNPDVKKLDIEKSSNGPVIVIYRRDGILEKYEWNDLKARELFKKRYGVLNDVPKEDVVQSNNNIIVDTAFGTWIDASLNGPGNPHLKPPIGDVLLVIDGVIQLGTAKLNELDPDKIASINVLKNIKAALLYGEKVKGKDGVIEIITKGASQGIRIDTIKATSANDTVLFEGKPSIILRDAASHASRLYVVDGIEFSGSEMDKMNIDPNSIESITVLKSESATKLYGTKAKDGVVIIKLKKPITKIEIKEPWDSDRIMGKLKNSDEVVSVINGNTYVAGGGAVAMQEGVIKHICVFGKVYTPEEVNRLFRKDQFRGAGTIRPETMHKVHGIYEPSLHLSWDQNDYQKYLEPKNATNQP